MKQVKLKKARTKLRLSHQDIADRVGISRCFYTQIETGTRYPRLEIAFKISEVLGIPINDLFIPALSNNISTGTEGN